jgi:uncharacterized repeat protein (TIGR03833 family)
VAGVGGAPKKMSYVVGSRYPKSGEKVLIVQKKDYVSGELTEGIVKDVLTSKQVHPRGHKVRLTNGIIGRVQRFADQAKEPEEKEEVTKPSSEEKYLPSDDDLV